MGLRLDCNYVDKGIGFMGSPQIVWGQGVKQLDLSGHQWSYLQSRRGSGLVQAPPA